MKITIVLVICFEIVFGEYPTQMPNKDPTEMYTEPPNSPLICPDYAYDPITETYDEYPTIDVVDFDVMTKKTRVILGPRYENITAATTAEFVQTTKTCNINDGCNFQCSATAGCYQSIFTCHSPTGCNIACTEGFACGKLQFYATEIVTNHDNINGNGQQIHVECYKDACQEMEIFIDGVDSAHIHCKEEDACYGMIVYFDNITNRNNHNTSVTCYVENACTNLKIFADGELTKLHMYGHSKGIILNNGHGLSGNDGTITCDLHTKFVQYIYADASHANYLSQLIRTKQTGLLPCEGINVTCLAGSCMMNYEFPDKSIFDRLPEQTNPKFNKFVGSNCLNIALYDMTTLKCQGNCEGSNTFSPTTDPTGFPTTMPTSDPNVETTDIMETTVETESKIQCKDINNCDKDNGYKCVTDPVCLGKKGRLFCENKKICLNTYGKCSCNKDCDGSHECGFRGGRGFCIKYQ